MPRSGWSISASARTTPRSSARTASARRWSTSAIGCRSSPGRRARVAAARNRACAAGSSAKAASPDLSAAAAASLWPSTIRARISRVQPSTSRGLAASRAARRATIPSIIACCSPAGSAEADAICCAVGPGNRGHRRGRACSGKRALISMPMSLATLDRLGAHLAGPLGVGRGVVEHGQPVLDRALAVPGLGLDRGERVTRRGILGIERQCAGEGGAWPWRLSAAARCASPSDDQVAASSGASATARS